MVLLVGALRCWLLAAGLLASSASGSFTLLRSVVPLQFSDVPTLEARTGPEAAVCWSASGELARLSSW